MAIQWSGVSGHLQVGIDVRHDPVSASTTHINVYVDVWLRVVNWRYQDDMVVQLRGSRSRDWPITLNEPSTATREYFIGTETIASQGLSYSGGPTYTFGAGVAGAYDGSVPGITINWSLPKRPAGPPNTPGAGIDYVTATGFRVAIIAPGTNGSPITGYQTLVGTNTSDGVNSVIASQIRNVTTGGTHTVTGLSPYTLYGVIVRARSAAGDSGWRYMTVRTLAGEPDPPSNVRLDDANPPGPDTISIAWTAPTNTGGRPVAGYRVEWSTRSDFTADTTAVSLGSGTSYTITGLTPGATYYIRVRTSNQANIPGPWSPTLQAFTMSKNLLKHPTRGWVPVRVWLKVPAVGWRQVRVWKRPPGGSWTV